MCDVIYIYFRAQTLISGHGHLEDYLSDFPQEGGNVVEDPHQQYNFEGKSNGVFRGLVGAYLYVRMYVCVRMCEWDLFVYAYVCLCVVHTNNTISRARRMVSLGGWSGPICMYVCVCMCRSEPLCICVYMIVCVCVGCIHP
jgi:hypothetical protein